MPDQLFRSEYGLQRVTSSESVKLGQDGLWYVDEDHQLEHGLLTKDVSLARRWSTDSGAYKFLKKGGRRFLGKFDVKAIPGTVRAVNSSRAST